MTNTAEESMRRDPGMAKNRNEGRRKTEWRRCFQLPQVENGTVHRRGP